MIARTLAPRCQRAANRPPAQPRSAIDGYIYVVLW